MEKIELQDNKTIQQAVEQKTVLQLKHMDPFEHMVRIIHVQFSYPFASPNVLTAISYYLTEHKIPMHCHYH